MRYALKPRCKVSSEEVEKVLDECKVSSEEVEKALDDLHIKGLGRLHC